MWVGTVVAGVNVYDKSLTKFSIISSDPNNPEGLSSSLIRGIYEDADSKLWIATTNGGINVLDRRTDTYTHYRHNFANPNTVSTDNIKCFFEDENFMWVGTGQGLNRFDKKRKSFKR